MRKSSTPLRLHRCLPIRLLAMGMILTLIARFLHWRVLTSVLLNCSTAEFALLPLENVTSMSLPTKLKLIQMKIMIQFTPWPLIFI